MRARVQAELCRPSHTCAPVHHDAVWVDEPRQRHPSVGVALVLRLRKPSCMEFVDDCVTDNFSQPSRSSHHPCWIPLQRRLRMGSAIVFRSPRHKNEQRDFSVSTGQLPLKPCQFPYHDGRRATQPASPNRVRIGTTVLRVRLTTVSSTTVDGGFSARASS